MQKNDRGKWMKPFNLAPGTYASHPLSETEITAKPED
jgi:hypothetical protein